MRPKRIDAFYLKINLEGKSVEIIDDVITTGATMRECVRTIKHMGKGCLYYGIRHKSNPRSLLDC